MKSTFTAALSLAGLVSTVAGHGYILTPKPRMPGPAMSAACGQQMFNNQNSDNYGNVQGELQVAKGQTDFDAAACNVWQCKGYQFDDNKDNVHEYTAGQVVPMTVEIRAPHTGTANVSIVKTSSGSVIGAPLISWKEYAANSASIPAEQTKFDITIPSDIGSACSTAGDCVIQWFWDARSVDQTYEACIDFTVGGSGSAPTATPSASAPFASAPASSASAAPTATAVAKDNTDPTPVEAKPSATPSATPIPSTGGNGTSTLPETFGLDQFVTWLQASSAGLPESFTLDQFIAWFKTTGGSSTDAAKLRRHARAFF
ncbi:chitin binding domain-containing protein [Massariosphaeria phaeospora]|uniref:Chitin binding domain-containing protein n=1 Tax=Massariosphaeria phaeospora TaxID=100035 RepID=A0A7C8M7X5_9PLEO|nr:chitin binding domain-containing protein [Massariosphaeria phaeospora]